MSEGEKELPQGWVWAHVGEFSNMSSGGTPSRKKAHFYVGDIPWCKIGDLNDAYISQTQEFISDSALQASSAKLVPKGTLLLAMYGASIGKLGITKISLSTNQAIACIQPLEDIRAEYLFYFFRLIRRELIKLGQGGAQPNISQTLLNTIHVSIAPLSEQSRIVDKIDELFSSIEAGERAIARARTALARYRKAVLKAAVTGELTADWRAKNSPSETAQDLLARILKVRYSAWEKAELEKLDAKGKARPETEKEWAKFRTKYKVPVEPNSANSSNLPKGWLGVTVDQISEFITSGSRGWAKYYSAEGPLFVRVGNFNRSSIELDFKKLQCVSPPVGVEGARTKLQLNDLLISITADVGMVGIFRGQYEDAYINQHVALVRMPDDVNEEWVAWAIVNPTKQQEILGTGRGATKDGLTLSDLRELRIPFPPAEEQDEIVSRVEQALSKADKAEATLSAQAKQAKALKQAVLKTAFEGRLVPQDPKDEPASELLKRIKAAS